MSVYFPYIEVEAIVFIIGEKRKAQKNGFNKEKLR